MNYLPLSRTLNSQHDYFATQRVYFNSQLIAMEAIMLTFFTLSALIFGIIFTGNLLAEGILSQTSDNSNDNDLALDGIFFHW